MTEEVKTPDFGPELNLRLNVAEINFIVTALRKLPMEHTEGLVNKIRVQSNAGYAAYQQAQALTAKTETTEANETGESK